MLGARKLSFKVKEGGGEEEERREGGEDISSSGVWDWRSICDQLDENSCTLSTVYLGLLPAPFPTLQLKIDIVMKGKSYTPALSFFPLHFLSVSLPFPTALGRGEKSGRKKKTFSAGSFLISLSFSSLPFLAFRHILS